MIHIDQFKHNYYTAAEQTFLNLVANCDETPRTFVSSYFNLNLNGKSFIQKHLNSDFLYLKEEVYRLFKGEYGMDKNETDAFVRKMLAIHFSDRIQPNEHLT